MEYLVRCALPASVTLVKADQKGVKYSFKGQLGLAPAWQTGACDTNCQEIVSACMIALVNTALVMPADFTRNADLKFPLGSMEQEINDVAKDINDPETNVSIWKRQQAARLMGVAKKTFWASVAALVADLAMVACGGAAFRSGDVAGGDANGRDVDAVDVDR